eukprot:comp18301_c0_seq1/m.32475 comp18301_c0_seq1/g.32475  ORF comp18301_c0_seq1/g.32475 comp18301_c0_seq1/m.32475 type:complete len:298 (-) comp18301_c0_seq1:240-1133(-)
MLSVFGAAATVDIDLVPPKSGKVIDVATDNVTETLLVYQSHDDVSGEVVVNIPNGKRLEHQGIKIELLGQIEMYYDRGNHYDFQTQTYELEPAGELNSTKRYPFEFSNVEKPYESYNGINVRLRYFIRVTIARSAFSANIVKEKEFFVQNLEPEPEINSSIKMEVGIEDCLHIEFEYNKSKYHLKDVIIGKIYFVLVRIKIKHMEIALIKRESTGSGANLYNENETVTKFEIMDGAPVRGESIPIRMFLSGLDIVPTYRNIMNKFSLKWYLNLVLVDEEDRRYFKQQEIMMRRQTLD